MNWLRILPPVAVLVLAVLVARHMISNPVEPPRRPAPRNVVTVEGRTLHPQDYQVIVRTQGNVEPHTETRLIPQVAGYLVQVAPSFRDGGFFRKGDLLVEIDPSDYRTALVDAESALAQAEAALETEKARSAQARENWDNLNIDADPNPLALRKPQLAQAEAAVASAAARVEKARRDLERTRITAPYDGRIRGKGADVGQYVTPGTVIASIFAVDYVEVRLPVPPSDAVFIDLPEQVVGQSSIQGPQPKVHFRVYYGDQFEEWDGRITRTEGVMDVRSRQIMTVAQIDSPYSPDSPDKSPLKIGQFMAADILGRELQDVFVLPRSSVRDDDHIYIIRDGKTLQRMDIDIIWGDAVRDEVVVQGNLRAGDVLCITPVPFAVNGMEVSPIIDGVAPVPDAPGGGGGPPGARGKKNQQTGD